ncbi:MAG: DNA replication/repair protein RecF [Solirubrobacterales bacterium]
MLIASLECRGFRNLADARTGLAPGISVLHGPNGAGKTNLLEAIYFGLAGRSFKAGSDRDMIRHDEHSARVELTLDGAEGSLLLAALDRSGERRHRVDGRPLTGARGERPLVSVFHPDRLQLVKGPAAHRRAHLDRLVGALRPSRSDLRARFGRTLAQRNALVSRIRAGQASAASLATWDERLAAEAVPLIASRAEAVDGLAEPFTRLGGSLGLEAAELRYRPRAGLDREAIETELAARRERELGRAYTTYGPQLDEIEVRLGGRPLRRFASQGQQRVALLALLFAEREALLDARRPAPVMLLDDVMSELDPTRRALLVEALAGAAPAVITATEREHVPAAPGLRPIAVRDGRTTALAAGDAAAREPGDEERAAGERAAG